MTLEIRKQANEKRQLMRSFLKKIVSNDERAKQLGWGWYLNFILTVMNYLKSKTPPAFYKAISD